MADYHATADVPVPSKADLLRALRDSRDQVVNLVASLPPARLEAGRYEGGWNGRQILAHVASIEWSYPRLIDIARSEPPPDDAPPPTRTRAKRSLRACSSPAGRSRAGGSPVGTASGSARSAR